MIKFYDQVNTSRSLLNYDIDGIVYKLDSISDQEKLEKHQGGQDGR